MKAFKMTVIGLFGLMASGMASAQVAPDYDQVLNSGSNNLIMGDCPLLANDIRIILTNGVVGAIACHPGNTTVALSVCHGSGLTSNRSETVARDEPGEGESVGACPAGSTDGGVPTAPCIATVSGAKFPSASTQRGTVSSLFPDAACDTADAQTIASGLASQP